MFGRQPPIEPPLPYFRVLEEEYERLYGQLPSDHPDWTFTADQVLDPVAAAAAVLNDAGEIPSPSPDGGPAEPPVPEDKAAVAARLNALLERKDLYPALRKAALRRPLRWETARLFARDRRPDDLPYLNRMLLEDVLEGAVQPIAEVRFAAICRAIHALGEKRAALCLSGGGIRSATFGLGVLQGLARAGLLDRFHYLSTVSGGGYIGSWLSAWIHRHPEGMAGVAAELAAEPQPRLDPEPAPIRHLRSYSNYMTPRLGLLSADTWTLVATYLRNLLLNWFVIVPALVAILALPRLALAIGAWTPQEGLFHLPILIGYFAALPALIFMSVSRPGLARVLRGPRARRWVAMAARQSQLTVVCLCLLPLLLSAFSLTTYWAWVARLQSDLTEPLRALPWDWITLDRYRPFVSFGLALHLVAVAASIVLLQRWQHRDGRLTGLLVVAREVLTAAVTAAAGGLMVWWLSTEVTAWLAFAQPYYVSWGLPVWDLYVVFATPAFLVVFLITATLFVGLGSGFTEDEDREWWARFGAWILVTAVAWAVVGLLVVKGPDWMASLWALKAETGWTGLLQAVTGLVGLVSGAVTLLLGAGPGTKATPGRNGTAAGSSVTRKVALALAAPVFAAYLVVLLSMVVRWLHFEVAGSAWFARTVGQSRFAPYALHVALLPVILGAATLSALLSWPVNINKFSLHAMYRNRLIRAYLGASNPGRDPNVFTGFDPHDNVTMHRLCPRAPYLDRFADPRALVAALADARGPGERAASEPIVPARPEPKPPGEPAATVAAGLRDALREDTKALLRQHGRRPASGGLAFPAALARALLRDLNARLEGPPLADTARSKEAQAILGRSCRERTTEDGARLNRLLLEEAFPGALPDDRSPADPAPAPHRPLHVVNVALNLVRGDRLAWQQRKAEPFTVSALHAGSCRLGYRRSTTYGGSADLNGRPISLGTALAISGAAASPNMGYHSSPGLTFLMTLFNVRLGWWLGNPGVYGDATYGLSYPRTSVLRLFEEALGLTNDRTPYVYLSDGGHFDNLGLYEMVLRRSHWIVVSDAGRDPDCAFDDLANAIRKIRVDLGVPIRIDDIQIKKRPRVDGVLSAGAPDGRYCAIGTIEYSKIDRGAPDGVLLYIKPALCDAEPADVRNYALTNDGFPHEPTSDQWFSEAQFESYRMLGQHTIEQICGRPWSLPAAFEGLRLGMLRHLETPPGLKGPLGVVPGGARSDAPAARQGDQPAA